ncbi:MAG: SRPBCC domain-containing protein [Thermomicrobiales bacterium]
MTNLTTSIEVHINAPPHAVYGAITSADAVHYWMVPNDMTIHIHEFDATPGGNLRISLTYQDRNSAGKTSAHTDTYHGCFVELMAGQCVVQVLKFETDDPTMQGEMTARFEMEPEDGGTKLTASHCNLPAGLSASDNETGWRIALRKLAALVEGASAG